MVTLKVSNKSDNQTMSNQKKLLPLFIFVLMMYRGHDAVYYVDADLGVLSQ